MIKPGGEKRAVAYGSEALEPAATGESTAKPGDSRLPAAFRSLRHRDYRLFLTSALALSTGMWMEQTALSWLVYELTRDPFYLGLLGFCRAIPVLFFSLFGGVLADRISRRTILLFTRSGLAILAFTLAILVTTGLVNVWIALFIAVLTGVVQSLNHPARQAIIYDLIDEDDLMNAIALHATTNNSARIIGPAMAGLVIYFTSVEGSFYAMGAVFALGVIPIALIKAKAKLAAHSEAGVLGHISEGLTYIRRDQTVLTLILLALIPMVFAMPYTQLMPVFADEILGMGKGGNGLLLAASGVGAVTGAVSLAIAANARRRGLLMLAASLACGVFLASFSLSQWLPLSLVLMACVGGMNTIYLATNNTLLQTLVTNQYRGRVMGVYNLDRGLVPLGSLFAGTVASLFNAQVAVFVMGSTVIVLVVVVLLAVPHMRRVE